MDDVTGGVNAGDGRVDGSAGDPTAAALAHVIQDYGRRAGESPARLKAMLNDSLAARAGDHRAAVDALVVAAEEGVPAALAGMSADDTERAAALAQRLTGWGLSAEMAGWAISTWAAALGGAVSLPALPLTAASLPPTSLPPTSLPATSLPATSLPPTTVPPPRYGGPVPPVAPTPAPNPGAEVVYGPAPTDPPGRGRRAFVAAGVVVVLAAVAGTAYALSGSDGTPVAHSSQSGSPTGSAGPSYGAPGENTPSTEPSTSPSSSPSPTASVTTPSSPAATHTHAPTSHATRTAVKPPPPKPKPKPTTTPVPNPVAANWSAVYTVKVCGTDWCEASWVLHDGGVWDKVVIVSTSPGYGRARGSGKTLYYWPRQNGKFTDYVKFYVLNSKTGQKSNVATFTVTVNCNTGYVCS